MNSAWASRGANLACKSGEVTLILGDDSCGKTRLLTAISEVILTPPKSSRSTVLARGKVSIGGLDTTKWEKSRIKRKVSVMLNDARTLADMSQYYSGSTVTEILQPACLDVPQPLRGATMATSVNLASKLSGISSTIIPNLSLKLQTTVTANEDELGKQSNLNIVSAASWSKIILTKVLAQAIACNDNPISSSNTIPNCLLGSVLILDDVTTYMDEVEESKFIKELRASGAASILTSKRWTLGRLVDKIVVMKNGFIIESGTHRELLAKGAMQSIYAKKWSEIQ